jgi:hypothetical protein
VKTTSPSNTSDSTEDPAGRVKGQPTYAQELWDVDDRLELTQAFMAGIARP